MPRFAANLTMMFAEWPFLDRFAAAADAGFTAVEFLFPYDQQPDAIGERLRVAKLTQALFNLPPGDTQAGERGLAVFPDRFEELKSGVERALAYADATGVKRLHLMAGIASPSDARAGDSYRSALRWTAERLARNGLAVVIEPLNGRDAPGYFLNDFAAADALIRELAIPNLRLQFDIYHRQILHGDVAVALRAMMPIIGHVQIASVPSRHEPAVEDLNYPFLFAELDRLGYDGFVGCEYRRAPARSRASTGSSPTPHAEIGGPGGATHECRSSWSVREFTCHGAAGNRFLRSPCTDRARTPVLG